MRKKRGKIAVLASGGIDSSILIAAMAHPHQVYPVYIRAGLNWERAELYWLRRFLKKIARPGLEPLTVLEMPTQDLYHKTWSLTGRHVPGYHSRNEEVYLPGRNLLLLTKAAVFCAQQGISEIALGILKGNPFPDATPQFFRGFSKLASQSLGFQIKILTPLAKLKKNDLLKICKGLPLYLTFSCLAPRGYKPCGHCNKCAERDHFF